MAMVWRHQSCSQSSRAQPSNWTYVAQTPLVCNSIRQYWNCINLINSAKKKLRLRQLCLFFWITCLTHQKLEFSLTLKSRIERLEKLEKRENLSIIDWATKVHWKSICLLCAGESILGLPLVSLSLSGFVTLIESYWVGVKEEAYDCFSNIEREQ